MGIFRTAVGAPWQETSYLTVTLVDVDGVPGGISVGTVSVSGIGSATDTAATAGGGNGELVPQAKRTNIELSEINARLGSKGSFCYYRVGAGNIQAGWADVTYDVAGSISAVNIYDSAGALVGGNPTFAVPEDTATAAIADAFNESLGAVNQRTIKNAPGNLLSVVAHNISATTDYWLQFFDAATPRSNGATPLNTHPLLRDNGSSVLDRLTLGDNGKPFATGIHWAISTTPLTLTLGTASDVIVQARYN